jgi:predicted RNase H-like HicB family nuclease
MKVRTIIRPAEDGGYWAEVPALPGCVSQGETMEETMANVREAITGWLAVATESAIIEPDSQLVEIEV